MTRMIIFDDGRGQFGPMTDLRAAFEIRTGMETTARRIHARYPKTLAGYWTPEAIHPIVSERANAPVNAMPPEEELWCVSGRLALPPATLDLALGDVMVEEATGDVIAARLRRAEAEYFLTSGEIPERARTRTVSDRMLYRFPWDILGSLPGVLAHDLAMCRLLHSRMATEVATVIGEHPVHIHESATIYPNTTFDAERGAIIIHGEATIRPGAILCGPCSIGPGSTVLDQTLIKPNTVIGPMCKIAGEVGGTIFQGYANKAHDGHLGDSWVGKWANLGAGTTNSNLLNTYGEVVMRLEPGGARKRTGMTFLGAIIGDHVKTAIGTRIMTGTVLGTGAMVASSTPPPTTVERFAWITDDGVRSFRIEKFIEIMKTVMARRKREPSEAYVRAIDLLHDAAAPKGSAS